MEELEHAWLKEGWSADTVEHGAIEAYVESDTAKSKTSWVAHQVLHLDINHVGRSPDRRGKVWGFQVIDGVRRHTRHVKFTGPKGEDVQTLMVYDYGASLRCLAHSLMVNAWNLSTVTSSLTVKETGLEITETTPPAVRCYSRNTFVCFPACSRRCTSFSVDDESRRPRN